MCHYFSLNLFTGVILLSFMETVTNILWDETHQVSYLFYDFKKCFAKFRCYKATDFHNFIPFQYRIETHPVKYKSSRRESCSGISNSFQPQGQNTGVGSLSLLQGTFATQGSNPGLLHCRWILYQLNHKGSPRILEWVAYPFSSGSSQPRNRTGVSCIAGGFFPNWAIREALFSFLVCTKENCETKPGSCGLSGV